MPQHRLDQADALAVVVKNGRGQVADPMKPEGGYPGPLAQPQQEAFPDNVGLPVTAGHPRVFIPVIACRSSPNCLDRKVISWLEMMACGWTRLRYIRGIPSSRGITCLARTIFAPKACAMV